MCSRVQMIEWKLNEKFIFQLKNQSRMKKWRKIVNILCFLWGVWNYDNFSCKKLAKKFILTSEKFVSKTKVCKEIRVSFILFFFLRFFFISHESFFSVFHEKKGKVIYMFATFLLYTKSNFDLILLRKNIFAKKSRMEMANR